MLTKLVDERRDLMIRVTELDRLIALETAALHQSSSVTLDQDLISAPAAAKRLGISVVYVYELARTKQIPATRIGRAVRFRISDLTTYANRRTS
jgi:excisionase family DNA binding protein